MSSWLDKLDKNERIESYESYLQAKREIDEPTDITFEEWMKMEREIEKNLDSPVYEYEVVIPYYTKFLIQSNSQLTKEEVLQAAHNDGGGSIIGYNDDEAEITMGEVKEDV